MTEPHEQEPAENEPTEPTVTDVPEPDQEPHEPIPDEADDHHEEEEAHEEETQPDAEPDTQEASGLTQEQWEAIFAKSDKAFDAYVKKINTIWEEEALNLLPVVVSPSAPPGFLHKADAGRVPDDVKQPILEFFGIAREQDYADDPDTVTCSACAGKGKTKTGSTVPTHETRTCVTCKGYGYTTKSGTAISAAVLANGTGGTEPEQTGPLVTEDVDNWNEPRILPDGRLNPNYGRQPQFKEQVEPYGITAGVHERDTVTA